MAGKYVRVGLRRDKNFADLENTYLSLGNLLNNLAPSKDKTFIPDDITVINNLTDLSNVSNQDFLDLNGLTVESTQNRFRLTLKFTTDIFPLTFTAQDSFVKDNAVFFFDTINEPVQTIDEENDITLYTYTVAIRSSSDDFTFEVGEEFSLLGTPIIIEEVGLVTGTVDNFLLQPLITVKDRVDNYKIVTEDPPYLAGGDGLKARFYPSTQIADKTQRDENISIYELFNYNEANGIGGPGSFYGPFDFWDSGTFLLGNNFYDAQDFDDGFGGVYWEGYFAGIQTFLVNELKFNTYGLLMVEQDLNGNGNWQKLVNIYNAEREVTFASGSVTNVTEFAVTSFDIKSLGIGDNLIDLNGQSYVGSGINITNIDYDNNIVTISSDVPVVSGTNTIKFGFSVGTDRLITTARFIIPYGAGPTKLRIAFFFPNEGEGDANYGNDITLLSTNFEQLGSSGAPSSYFYSQEPAILANPDENSYRFFEQNFINNNNKTTSEVVQINSQAIARYNIPLTYNSVATTVTALHALSGSFQLPEGVTATPGDKVIFPSLGLATSVLDVPSDIAGLFIDPIFADTNLDASTNYSIVIVKGTGLVDIQYRPNGTSEFSSSLGLSKDYLVQPEQILYTLNSGVTNGPAIIDAVTYDEVLDTFTYTVNDYFVGGYSDFLFDGETSGTFLLIFKSTSVEDLSKLTYCEGVIGRRLTTQALVGTNILSLDDVSGISQNDYVQFSGFIPDGTQITSIDTNAKTIALNNSLTKTLNANYTITILGSDPGTNSYEICVLPLDTAPPFVGTDTGLKTDAVGTIEKLSLTDSNSELVFDNFYIKDIVTEEDQYRTYSKTMDISYVDNLGNKTDYKLLVF